MKCDNCPAGWETNTENGYEGGCHLEGLIDSKYDYVDGGCTIHYKTVNKLMDEHEQHQSEQRESYVNWYLEREKIFETCVICGETNRGTDTTACDDCGQTICYHCWERERSERIHNGTVPKCCKEVKK